MAFKHDAILRKLPDFKGKFRLAKCFARHREKEKIITGRDTIRYILPNIIESIGLNLYVNGVYEPAIISLIEHHLPEKGHFMDVGANIGSICLPVLTHRPDIQVTAFEPLPEILAYLKSNLVINSIPEHRFNLQNVALSNVTSEVVDFYPADHLYGKGSMSPVFSDKGISVPTGRLDNLLQSGVVKKPDVMKVDVEGFELEVFKGAKEFLSSEHPPVIIFEFVDWAEKQAGGVQPGSAQEFLFALGYRLFRLENKDLIPLSHAVRTGVQNLVAIKKH